jgi:hypothetical protein
MRNKRVSSRGGKGMRKGDSNSNSYGEGRGREEKKQDNANRYDEDITKRGDGVRRGG